MKLDDAGIPIRTYGFARLKIKPKPPQPKLVEVYFGLCKHKQVIKMWMLGTEKPDADGVFRARRYFEQCPDCERIDATPLPSRNSRGNSE